MDKRMKPPVKLSYRQDRTPKKRRHVMIWILVAAFCITLLALLCALWGLHRYLQNYEGF